MSELIQPIAAVRDAVCAVMRIRRGGEGQATGTQAGLPQFQPRVVGTAWCIVANHLLVTAQHVLNGGRPRDPSDRFLVFSVPQNGPWAYHVPVIGFPLEDPRTDMAILEIDPASLSASQIPAVPVTFQKQPDGTRVITYGFPSPEVAQAHLNEKGAWLGGQLFLKGHANEGIIAGQFDLDGLLTYELNVGWHHGESGGPIVCLRPVAAFAVMQRYRNIRTPHGIIPGPHQGRSLAAIEGELSRLGATIL